jgi:hypothetical protein
MATGSTAESSSCDGNWIDGRIVLRWQLDRRWNRPAMATGSAAGSSCDGNWIGGGVVLRWQHETELNRRRNRPARANRTRNGVVFERDQGIPILAEESMVCCRGNKLEMIYSHPNSDCYPRRSCRGSEHSNLAKGINGFSYSLQARNDLFPSNTPTTTLLSSLPEQDQSIPHLAVESMLSSKGNKLEMMPPLSFGSVQIKQWVNRTATDTKHCDMQCEVFFAIYWLLDSNTKSTHAGKPC